MLFVTRRSHQMPKTQLHCSVSQRTIYGNRTGRSRMHYVTADPTRCDEDLTNMDTPIVVAYNSKPKLFSTIIIFNTCDEWTLHYDMCSLSFIEVLTWIKEGVDHAWKGWIMKHLDWGPNTSAPYASTRSPRYLSNSRSSPHQNHH
jgi:hypothetical protein